MFSRSFRSASAVPRFAVARFAFPSPAASSTLQSFLSQRALSSAARSAIEDAVQGSPLVVFMKGTPASPQCGFSRAVVQILDVHGVSPDQMTTYNCLEDPELREGIKEFSDWPTIPQVYLKGEFVGGCDILLGMHQSGELEELLVKEGVVPAEIPSPSSEPTK